MTAPVSRSPIHPVQTAFYQRMVADAVLGGLVSGVFDEVPEGQAYPYVRLGAHLSIPDNAHGQFGRQITLTLHVWTKARGNAQGQAIADRIIELFDHQPLTVVGHRVVSVRCEFDQALTDPNPELRRHVLRFRTITTQEE